MFLHLHNSAPQQHITLAGLIQNGDGISTQVADFLSSLNCEFGVSMHILVAEGHDKLSSTIDLARRKYKTSDCAPTIIKTEPRHIVEQGTRNRVDKLSALREYQRGKIASQFTDVQGIIVLVDLDIPEMPSARSIVTEANNMIRNQAAPDILCSASQTEDGKYYDSFATILLPDTFVYPLEHRLNSEPRKEEIQEFILDKSWEGAKFLLNWLNEQGNGTQPVPVKSCFGGLALYRSSILFDVRCTYSDKNDENQKYSNKDDRRPCEHVVFHNCLRRVYPGLIIAVQPNLNPVVRPT